MASLTDYAAFIAIVEQGSLTAAARHLGRSLQAVSRALGTLEAELGVTLITRTTRSLHPTVAGTQFHARIKTALADIAFARDELAGQGAQLAGRIRIGASTLFGPLYVLPILTAFMERHPAVDVELAGSDRHVDMVAEGLDVAVRIGTLPDSGIMARRLGAVRRVVFAAPGYFAAHGRPTRPADLARHPCVLRRGPGATESWRFERDGAEETVEVRGRLRSDSPPARNEAVAAGMGIGLAPLYQIRHLLDAGRVELALTEYEGAPVPLHIVWPASPAMPNRTRTLVDFLAARLSLAGL